MQMFVTDHSINRILGLDVEQPRKRQRRNRTVFSDATITLLEKTFSENKYPDIKERIMLAKQIGEEEARVQVWFQNRRARQRRFRRPRASSDGTSSCASSSPKSSPSPPRVPPWLQQADHVDQKSTSSTNPFSCPSLVSPLPKTPRRPNQRQQRQQFSLWSPVMNSSLSVFTAQPPAIISPLPSTPPVNRGTIRLPLVTSPSSCSVFDFSQSEDRSADDKVYFNS